MWVIIRDGNWWEKEKNECRLQEALVHFTYMRLPRRGLANLCHSSHRPHDMLCMYTYTLV